MHLVDGGGGRLPVLLPGDVEGDVDLLATREIAADGGAA